MRYIGNKTKLLPFILETLQQLDIEPGCAHDAFAGTASVARALRRNGWRVATSDVLLSSYVFQRAYLDPPSDQDLLALLASELEAAAPEAGFITAHFTPAGERMYFTPENGQRIDGARRLLHSWRTGGRVEEPVYYALLAALIEGADRVANTTGVYASYVKQWQPNALKLLTIVPEGAEPGPASEALHADAISAAESLSGVDLLYIDPPYNTRQYVAYYHIPEIIARGWFDAEVPSLRGKVGLLADSGGRSSWSHGRRVKGLFTELLRKTTARHVLVSFNSEGHISEPDLLEVLRAAAVDHRVERFACGYRRYRADRDRVGRRYSSDTVQEHLYYARLR
jgi:adenine-specific DNA-methyltransferase